LAKAWEGHSKYLQKRWQERAKQGNCLQPVVLTNLQGKGYERKEAFWLT
jgi:hypothetical protein